MDALDYIRVVEGPWRLITVLSADVPRRVTAAYLFCPRHFDEGEFDDEPVPADDDGTRRRLVVITELDRGPIVSGCERCWQDRADFARWSHTQ
jgi:hypothetical protein